MEQLLSQWKDVNTGYQKRSSWAGFHYMEKSFSKIVGDLFLDNPDAESGGTPGTDDETKATNRTGNYSVLMKLDSNIPQLLPMAGRRIKIYYTITFNLKVQALFYR